MNTEILVALIAASASILGAALTFYRTKSKERSDEHLQRKQSQYQELLFGISDLADHTNDQAGKRFAAAFNTIVLVAPQDVITPLMAYYRELTSGDIDPGRINELRKNLILEIRKDLELPFKDNPTTFEFEIVGVGGSGQRNP